MKRTILVLMAITLLIFAGCAHEVYQARCGHKVLMAYGIARDAGYDDKAVQIRTGMTKFDEYHAQLFVYRDGEWTPWGIAVSEGTRFPTPFSERRILAGDGYPELKSGIKIYSFDEFMRTFYPN